MDVLGTLPIRFHFNGEFVSARKDLFYCGGREAMSYIDRDHVSLPEIYGHLKDHCHVQEGALLHWKFPGKGLVNGLRVLVDDKSCLEMADNIVEGGVAEIYVEDPGVIDITDEHHEQVSEKTPSKVSVITESRDKIEKQIQFLKEFYSPSKVGQSSSQPSKVCQQLTVEEFNESSDSEYLPGDECPSEEDEETTDIMNKFREFKSKMKAGEPANLDDVVLEAPKGAYVTYELEDDDNATSYEDSDGEEDSIEEISDGEVASKDSKYPRYNNKESVPKFEIGMKFTGKKQFKKAVIKHGLAERRLIKFIKNEGSRMIAKCDWTTCQWRCLVSVNSRTDSWQIASLNDVHNCPPRRDNRLVTAAAIAKKYEKMIMANPTWSLESMKNTIQEDMFADVHMSKLKRAKSIVMQKVFDATKGQYKILYNYQLELLRSNPGSTVVIRTEPRGRTPVFQRMYICLDALKKGFNAGCRKVVGLDGCFFKGATNGELLCAVGRDANNQMYPVAWAVVEKENNDSWDWFCDLLFRDIGVGEGNDWVFISDQQKGILTAVAKWAPNAEHRNCARHIYANWRKKHKKKEWQKKFWACAKAPCISLFNLAKARLAKDTKAGAEAIMNTDPHHWSRAWFRLGSNCDSVDNNMCESFNKWIVEARYFPIITMLETIRRKVMIRIQSNRSKLDNWNTIICPNILKKMNSYITLSSVCHAICNGQDQFEVRHYNNMFAVDLNKKECSCRYWQLSGLPCPHAISCIFFKTNAMDEYIASCFTVDAFKKTYNHCLMPVEGMQSWPQSDTEPMEAPGYIKMPGRPKKERKREPSEKPKAARVSRVGTVIRCRKCKQIGHNRSTCEKRNGQPSTAGSGSIPASFSNNAAPEPSRVLSSTQQSHTAGTSNKRKATNDGSQQSTTAPINVSAHYFSVYFS